MREEIKELFEKHEIRKSKKQKSEFIEFIRGIADKNGYSTKIEGGSFGTRNIVIGDPNTAKVTYTAHYDTCARLPFPNFITPKHIWIYVLYQLAITFAMFLIPAMLGAVLTFILGKLAPDNDLSPLVLLFEYLVLVLEFYLIAAGPANPHTANDNTSGVATLIEVLADMSSDKKGSVAFIFFDNEELGLVGSASYYSKHKKTLYNKLILNFDCVSDGKNIIFVMKKNAFVYENALKKAYPPEGEYAPEFLSKHVFNPSDQLMFPCGVGACALNKSKSGILYMNKIYTKNDVVFDEENIEYLKRGSLYLAELLSDSEGA